MLVLFDQATPVPLRLFLKGHIVKTAWQQGWDRLRNGDLLRMAEDAGFELLLTTDKNLHYQQNFTGRKNCSDRTGPAAMARSSPARAACCGRSERCHTGQLCRSGNSF